jgi:adenylate cyclase, class 2
MSHSQQETEIKLAVESAAAARRMLRAAGFRVSRARVFEANTIVDTPERALRLSGRLLRVRQAGRVVTATYKGPAIVNRHKSREELEFEASNAATLGLLFERLGYQPMFRYEKYRTELRRAGSHGVAMIDETPVGVFVELEGTPHWIDRMAHKLGFPEAAYITRSYGQLYREWCEREGCEPSHMVFTPDRSPSRSRAARTAGRKSPPARA